VSDTASFAAAVVADTIVRTVELGVTITDAPSTARPRFEEPLPAPCCGPMRGQPKSRPHSAVRARFGHTLMQYTRSLPEPRSEWVRGYRPSVGRPTPNDGEPVLGPVTM
jgi:hypothetical protein